MVDKGISDVTAGGYCSVPGTQRQFEGCKSQLTTTLFAASVPLFDIKN